MTRAQNHFGDRLTDAIVSKKTPLVVGLDPRIEQLPENLDSTSGASSAERQAEITAQFCCEVIDVVADLVPAVKPQAAFFERLGWHGMVVLSRVIDYAAQRGLMVILDAKRGDIGSTAQAYASAYLGPKPQSAWGCDCLTVNPYMGNDTLEPFVEVAKQSGSGIFVLVKTSNPGSGTIQEKVVSATSSSDQQKIYRIVAENVQQLSADSAGESGYGNIGAVIGATYPDQLAELREAMPNTIFLIPGFGAQGGSATDVAGGLDDKGLGGVINSSRGIIFAYQRPEFASATNWQSAVEQATRNAIEHIADGTTASRLR